MHPEENQQSLSFKYAHDKFLCCYSIACKLLKKKAMCNEFKPENKPLAFVGKEFQT